MGKMSVRSTYALDRETADSIRHLAGRWQTSQAEVIRRAVRLAAEHAAADSPVLTPADVIAHYRQAAPPRTLTRTRALIAELRKVRHVHDEERGAGSE